MRKKVTLPAGLVAGLCAVGVSATSASVAVADAPSPTTTLAGSAAPVTSNEPGVSAVAGTQSLTVQLWLAGDEQAAQQYVDAASTPGSPMYHQFLSPVAYTQRFGPSSARVQAVQSYLTAAGFSDVQASVNDDYVSATAPVATINQAFAVQIRNYRVSGTHGTPITIEANDSDLTVPTSISNDIVAITGLDSTPPQREADTAQTTPPCSQYWAQRTKAIIPAFQGITRAAQGVCGYSAAQVRAAYGQTSTDTGAGKTIALIEDGRPPLDMYQTLSDYAQTSGLPTPRSEQYREETVGPGGACAAGRDLEEQLDSEAAYAMAPGANQLMVDDDTCKKNGEQALLDAELVPLTGNGTSASVAIESLSFIFGGGEDYVPTALRRTSHAVALRAAAEGVSLLYASGDGPGVNLPAADPDVTAVGGTTLGIGAQDQRVFETGWSDAVGHQPKPGAGWQDEGIPDAAGGGASDLYPEPSYQRGVVPRTLAQTTAGTIGRAVPDIAADADPASGMLFGAIERVKDSATPTYTTFTGSGTSQSTPLVAGMIANAEQGQTDFGFLNPLLYSLAGSAAYHDIVGIDPTSSQVDRAGYTQYTYYIETSPGVYDIVTKRALGGSMHRIQAKPLRSARLATTR